MMSNPVDFMNGHKGISILRMRGLEFGPGVTSVEDVSLAMVVQIGGARQKPPNFFAPAI